MKFYAFTLLSTLSCADASPQRKRIKGYDPIKSARLGERNLAKKDPKPSKPQALSLSMFMSTPLSVPHSDFSPDAPGTPGKPVNNGQNSGEPSLGPPTVEELLSISMPSEVLSIEISETDLSQDESYNLSMLMSMSAPMETDISESEVTGFLDDSPITDNSSNETASNGEIPIEEPSTEQSPQEETIPDQSKEIDALTAGAMFVTSSFAAVVTFGAMLFV